MCHKCIAILLPQDEWLAVNLEGGCDDSVEGVIRTERPAICLFSGECGGMAIGGLNCTHW
jgi:hypothetical protein